MDIKKLNEELSNILEDSNVKEWQHNGKQFKELTVDTKEVEVIPGLTLKFNKVEHSEDDVYTKTTWELDNSINTNQANKAIMDHILNELGANDSVIGGWSGAIPLTIKVEED